MTNRYWNLTQGTSKAKVLAPDYAAALERGKQIGFPAPDSVVLVETAPEQEQAVIRAKLLHVLVAYDKRQSKKPSYNRYALSHYCDALAHTMELAAKGHSIRESLCDAFTGRLLDLCLKAVGEPKSTDTEQRGNICRVLLATDTTKS